MLWKNKPSLHKQILRKIRDPVTLNQMSAFYCFCGGGSGGAGGSVVSVGGSIVGVDRVVADGSGGAGSVFGGVGFGGDDGVGDNDGGVAVGGSGIGGTDILFETWSDICS